MKYYIIPSFKCNLSCKHCYVYTRQDNFNQQKFFSQLQNLDGELILFGGQPLLNFDLFKKCLNTNKFSSISTNLLLLNNQNLQLIKQYNLQLSTSWNPFRFSKQQFQLWKNNLNILNQNNIFYSILITLTKELLDISPEKFLNFLKSLSCYSIQFQPLIGMSQGIRNKIDNWLCQLQSEWPPGVTNVLKQNYLNKHILHCQNIWTLYPNGELLNKCPLEVNRYYILKNCLICKYSKVCKPCRIQKSCSFFYKYYEKIQKEI